MIKHIVNWSGGLCSFWAAHRVIQQHGRDSVALLFADTLIESPDLYDFNDKASVLLGVPLTRVCAGLTPWQLFRKQHMIGNNRYPICSVRLKREVLDAWIEVNGSKTESTIYVGFDFTEFGRLDAIRAA